MDGVGTINDAMCQAAKANAATLAATPQQWRVIGFAVLVAGPLYVQHQTDIYLPSWSASASANQRSRSLCASLPAGGPAPCAEGTAPASENRSSHTCCWKW